MKTSAFMRYENVQYISERGSIILLTHKFIEEDVSKQYKLCESLINSVTPILPSLPGPPSISPTPVCLLRTPGFDPLSDQLFLPIDKFVSSEDGE